MSENRQMGPAFIDMPLGKGLSFFKSFQPLIVFANNSSDCCKDFVASLNSPPPKREDAGLRPGPDALHAKHQVHCQVRGMLVSVGFSPPVHTFVREHSASQCDVASTCRLGMPFANGALILTRFRCDHLEA